MRVEYREEPCRSALNRVKGMPFDWSLNPYMGCVHRCTFCYVRAFERRADRPSDDRYGTSIRVKTNVVEVLQRELARASWGASRSRSARPRTRTSRRRAATG
jgi:DNA repair photolyase